MTIPENILPLNKVGENYFLDLPFLVKGKLVDPPGSDPEKIIAAFEKKVKEEGKQPRDVTYLKLDDAQVLREPLIDRESMVYHNSFLYQVMPLVNPVEAGYLDPASLVDELCLNIAPALLGSPRHTRLLGVLDAEVPVEPVAVHLDEGVLFVRYRLRA